MVLTFKSARRLSERNWFNKDSRRRISALNSEISGWTSCGSCISMTCTVAAMPSRGLATSWAKIAAIVPMSASRSPSLSFSSSSLRPLMSRMAQPISNSSSIGMGLRLTSTGIEAPSLRTAVSSIPLPIGLGWGAEIYSIRYRIWFSRRATGTRTSIGLPRSSSCA